jgi:alpha-1,6-mannosyltransferase
VRILQLANLVTPTSGGIRTVLARLREGYVARGHHVTVLTPAAQPSVELDGRGTAHVQLPGVPLPRSGGYRLLLDRVAIADAIDAARPDVIEIHDRFTLPWVAGHAADLGVPSLTFVHERLATSLRVHGHVGPLAGPLERAANRRLLDRVGRVVVASRYAAAAFPADDARVSVVPLAVEHRRFRPTNDAHRAGAAVRLVLVGRLAPEKRPGLALDTVRALVAAEVPCHLDVVGDGPGRGQLERRARRLPVTFHGHLPADAVAARLQAADVALALCPTEAFGLAALEALACGTAVVAPAGGAVRELLGHPAEADHVSELGATLLRAEPTAIARTVRALRAVTDARHRSTRVARASVYGWEATVSRLLRVHGVPVVGSA